MKESSSRDKPLYSVYFVVFYWFFLGVITYFYSTYWFFLEDSTITRDPSRAVFLFSAAMLTYQIYNISRELYQRLIDTIIVILFVMLIVYPTFCLFQIFIFNPVYFIFVFSHFLIIISMLYDKNK